MKLFLKIFALALFFALLFVLGFELWGEWFETVFDQQACVAWFAEIRGYAWAVGIGLLVADILLPVPATGIMAALGSVYGTLAGGLIAVAGSAGAGIIGYALARLAGGRAVGWLASEEERARFQSFFDRWGGGAVIASRILPILPEVMTILAGLARMQWSRFLAALMLGTVPTCFLFSALGHVARSVPVYGTALAVFIPLALWPLFLKFVYNGAADRPVHPH